MSQRVDRSSPTWETAFLAAWQNTTLSLAERDTRLEVCAQLADQAVWALREMRGGGGSPPNAGVKDPSEMDASTLARLLETVAPFIDESVTSRRERVDELLDKQGEIFAALRIIRILLELPPGKLVAFLDSPNPVVRSWTHGALAPADRAAVKDARDLGARLKKIEVGSPLAEVGRLLFVLRRALEEGVPGISLYRKDLIQRLGTAALLEPTMGLRTAMNRLTIMPLREYSPQFVDEIRALILTVPEDHEALKEQSESGIPVALVPVYDAFTELRQSFTGPEPRPETSIARNKVLYTLENIIPERPTTRAARRVLGQIPAEELDLDLAEAIEYVVFGRAGALRRAAER